MRRAAKTDANHSAIVNALREAGFSVWDTSAVGRGFPDCVAGIGRKAFLIEIKDGAKSPSRRRLTPDQEAFRASWQGHYEVIESVEQAKAWAKEIKEQK